MEQKFREIQSDEISNIKRITVSNLFIISKGLLSSRKVLLYYVRCYSYQSGVLEAVLESNKISSKLQAMFFLNRLGFINNTFEKSLTLVYECPGKGEVLTIEGFMDPEMDKGRKLNLFNEMFQIVYHVKKKSPSIEVGCLYPHLFFSFFNHDKHLLMVDYIYSPLLQVCKNNSIRLLNGYLGSNTCDEVLMSCIIFTFFFMELTTETSSIIQMMQRVISNINQPPEVQAEALSKNIEVPLIKSFIYDVVKAKRTITYTDFYTKFKDLHSKLKAIIPKSELKVNETFFKVIGETKEEIEKTISVKTELEYFFRNMPKVIHMTYSKEIDNKYFNDFKNLIEKKNNKKENLNSLNEEYNKLLDKYSNKYKEYLKYKLDKIKSQSVISEVKVTKLQNLINEFKQTISTINDINSNSSLLINLENDGKEITKRLEIFKTQIIPRLFQEYLRVIEDFPYSLQKEDSINFLCQKPQYGGIQPSYFPYIKQGTPTLEVFQLEMVNNAKKDKGAMQQTKHQFTCQFKTKNDSISQFPRNCKWLRYSSFIIVNGGEDASGNSIASTLIINLTQKSSITVYQRKDMKTAKKYHSLCMYNNYYMISLGGNTKGAELYSILSDEWTRLPELSVERENGVVCLFNERDLYYFGGKSESNSVEHLKMKEDNKDDEENEDSWSLLELSHGVIFANRAFIKYDQHNMHKLLILGGTMSNESSEDSYNSFMIDLNLKTVEEYKSKITFSINYKFCESEMNLILNSYVQLGVDEKNNAVLVSFAKGLFVVN